MLYYHILTIRTIFRLSHNIRLSMEVEERSDKEGLNNARYLGISVVQGDQLNMSVCFWYLVKSDLSSVHLYNSVHRSA